MLDVTISRPSPRKAALILSVAKALALGLVLVVLVSGFATKTPLRVQHPTALRLDLAAKDLQRAMVRARLHDHRLRRQRLLPGRP